MNLQSKNLWKKLTVSLSVGVMAGLFSLPARADDFNQQTKIEFTTPIEISGTVIPAGTYWLVLQNDDASRQIVKVMSVDGMRVYATELAVPVDRNQAAAQAQVEFAQPGDGSPAILLQWFYPGAMVGHAFTPTKREREQIAGNATVEMKSYNSNGLSGGNQTGF
jgi:hypothetical protein